MFNSGRIEATKTTGYSARRAHPGRTGDIHQYRHRRDLWRLQRRLRQRHRRLHIVRQAAGSITSTRGLRFFEATGGGTITNSGTIASVSNDGLYLARAATVTNSGTITGATRAINFVGNYSRTLNLDTGSVLNGLVQGGTGVDELVLLGTGAESAAKFLAFEKLKMQGH